MADQKLTDRNFLSTSSDNAIVHVVDSGVSYKQTKSNLLKEDRNRLDNLEENQYSSVVTYSTKASLPGTGTLLVSYKVTNDTTSSNNGYYHWDGLAYIKDSSLVKNDIDYSNSYDAVSGKAVSTSILQKSKKWLKNEDFDYTDLTNEVINAIDEINITWNDSADMDYVNGTFKITSVITNSSGTLNQLQIESLKDISTSIFFTFFYVSLPTNAESVEFLSNKWKLISTAHNFRIEVIIDVDKLSASSNFNAGIDDLIVDQFNVSGNIKLTESETAKSDFNKLNTSFTNFSYGDMYLNSTTTSAIGYTYWRPITLTDVTQLSSVELDITSLDYGKYFEFGIYNSLGAKVTSTGTQETGNLGLKEYPLEDYTMMPGVYYLAFTSNSESLFKFNDYIPSETSAIVSKLPTSKPTVTSSTGFVAYKLKLNKPNYLPSEIEDFSESTIRTLGINPNLSQPWGWNTLTAKMAVSVNSGATYTDMMPINLTWGWSPIDLVTDGNNLYILMFDFTILKSSDLSSSATWSNITPSAKNVDAQGFPYGLNIWNGYLYAGEYSGASPLATPPKLHKMELSSGTWSVSKQFTNAKHIHAVQSFGTAVMYVVCGDATYGEDVGLHRITQANQSIDLYQKVTAGETKPYPVNITLVGTKIFGSGDQPPTHIISLNEYGIIGEFIFNPNNFKESTSESGETCRAINSDNEGNLYYLAVETPTSHAIYVSPPPYIHRFKISNDIGSSGVNGRTVKSGDYFMNYEIRWKKSTFSFNSYR